VHKPLPPLGERVYILDFEPSLFEALMIHSICSDDTMASAGRSSEEILPYQVSSVGYWPTVPITGNGELGFGYGEGA